MPDPLTVLYDRDCGFCRSTMAVLLRLDPEGALLPEPIQGEVGQSLLARVPDERRLRSAHVVTPDGEIASGGDAAPVIAERLAAVRAAAPALRSLAGATRAAYALVAASRHRLGPLLPETVKARADRAIARHRAMHFGLGPPETGGAPSCALPSPAGA